MTLLTGGIATFPSPGDLVLIAYSEGSTTDLALSGKVTTAGFSLIGELYANDTYDMNMAVFSKVMGASPDYSVNVVGRAGTASSVVINVLVFRGVDQVTPFDVTATTATAIDTANANPAAITPVTADNVIAIFGANASTTSFRSFTTATTSYLSGFKQAASAGSTVGNNLGAGYVTGQPAGVSYDPSQWDVGTSPTTSSSGAVTIALRPAVISTGTASGTLDLTGTADGTVTTSVGSVTGTAAGTLDLTGSASGAALVTGTASGTLDLTGTADGVAIITGTATGSLPLTGAASGVALITGTVAGSISLTGSASGTVASESGSVTGTATGSLPLTGAASGVALITGAAAGSLPLTGTASGVALITGAAAGTLDLTGTASGAALVTGTASGTLPLTGAAAGALRVTGAAAGTLPLTGAATGIHASRSRVVRLGVDSEAEVMLFSGAGTDVLVYTGGKTGAVLSSGDGTDVLLLSGGETSVTLTQGV